VPYGSQQLRDRNGRIRAVGELETWPFREVSRLLRKAIGIKKFERVYADRLSDVVAGCADAIDGETLTTAGYFCHICRSGDSKIEENETIKEKKISVVTFNRFKSLSMEKQSDIVCALWETTKDYR